MKITINGTIGIPPLSGEVDDGKTTTFDVQDGNYKVFANFGVESNGVEVSISSNSVELTATVIPDKMCIEKVELTRKSEV